MSEHEPEGATALVTGAVPIWSMNTGCWCIRARGSPATAGTGSATQQPTNRCCRFGCHDRLDQADSQAGLYREEA
jgi:hypothetical protein